MKDNNILINPFNTIYKMKRARTRLANHPVCDVYILFILYKLRGPFACDMGDTHTDCTSHSTLSVYAGIPSYIHIIICVSRRLAI